MSNNLCSQLLPCESLAAVLCLTSFLLITFGWTKDIFWMSSWVVKNYDKQFSTFYAYNRLNDWLINRSCYWQISEYWSHLMSQRFTLLFKDITTETRCQRVQSFTLTWGFASWSQSALKYCCGHKNEYLWKSLKMHLKSTAQKHSVH